MQTSFAARRQHMRLAPSRGSWGLLRSVLSTGVCLVLFGALAVRALAVPRQPGFQSGVLRVEFSDQQGTPRATPYFHVADAYPRMHRISTVSIHNEGSLPATYEIRGVDLRSSERSLADVLVFQVKGASGRVLYQGRLPRMSIRGTEPLDPGRVATFSIETWWPDEGARDNLYRGQTLSFDFRLTSEPVTTSG